MIQGKCVSNSIFRFPVHFTLLSMLTLGLLGLQAVPRTFAQVNPVTVTLQQLETAAAPLNSTFNGLSFEKADATGPTLSGSNTSLVSLMTLLGPGVLRIGGSSAEQVVWQQNGGLTANGYTMTPPDVDRLASLLHATGWKLIYTLNFSIGALNSVQNPTSDQIAAAAAVAAQEAAYVASSVGNNLLGFEIGNEPDLFSVNGVRPVTYTFTNFASEWAAFANAIQAVTPSAQFVGPGASSMYDPYFQSFVPALGNRVVLATDHFYAGSGTEATALQMLLGNSGTYQQNYKYLSTYMLPTMDSLSQAVSVPYRIDETNAFGRGNAPGNSFGVALWALDYEFLAAAHHATGVNFHNNYAPIATTNMRGVVTGINPVYYAMKLFSMAANGSVLTALASAQQSTFSAYAVQASSGATYVVLNNKDPNNAVAATITFLQPVASATSMLLTAPTLNSTTGVTLGGATIGLDGSWPSPETDPVPVASGAATITVPAGSAAFITASPVTTSLNLQTAGLCAASMQNSTSGPYLLEQEPCNANSPAQQFAFVPAIDGLFYVVPQNSALCLDSKQLTSVSQTACAQSPTQEWSVTATAGSTYNLATADGLHCLNLQTGSAIPGTQVGLSPCGGQISEQISLPNTPRLALQSTRTPITVSYNNLCMDTAVGGTAPGPYIRQHACNGSKNQTFTFSSTVDGYYTIHSNYSQLCLDGTTQNSNIIQNNCTGVGAQKWQLIGNSDKSYTLANPGSQWCLGIANASNTSNTLFSVLPCSGGPEQKFLLPVAPAVLQPQQ
jgi:hypothetical protein